VKSERRPVLVAIDHASDVKRTLGVARSVAKVRGAEVHVVQVVPPGAVHVHHRMSVLPSESYDGGVSIGAPLAPTLRTGDHDGVRIRRVTLNGTPEHVIPAYSQLHQATLLVVERNYGSWRFWRNGRVVDDLARQSPMPVLVLPKGDTPDEGEPWPRRILTAVDFSIASAVALRTAVDVSRRRGARITLVHALTGVPGHMVVSGGEAVEVVRRLRAQRSTIASRLRRHAASLGLIDVDVEVTTGYSDSALLEAAARNRADLLVMGVAHRSSFDRVLLGSTLRRVLRRATVPVLAIPVVAGAHPWPDAHGIGQIRSAAEMAVDRLAA
jgi:nucleotide-binding universal stress UspA family protein